MADGRNVTLYIRADANPRMGTGHVMRTLALAQAADAMQVKPVFVGCIESEAIQARIHKEGFELIPVINSYPHPGDAELMGRLLQKEEEVVKWVALDGYHFDSAYQKEMQKFSARLLLIDDTAHQPAYCGDIVLNQNSYANELRYRTDPETDLLLGTDYVLLRREFLGYSDNARRIKDRAERVLVTLGGGDPDNVTQMVAEALARTGLSFLDVRFVVGPANPHRKGLEKVLSGAGFTHELLDAVTDMPRLMAWADMAITAGGSTCWEIAFMGLPALVIVVADNQENVARGLDAAGAAVNCGWFRSLSVDTLAERCAALVADRKRRVSLAENGRRLVDGNGAGRVVRKMLSLVKN